MTRLSIKEKIVGQRLPMHVVDKLKAKNIDHLHELSHLPELLKTIEIKLNPIQKAKLRMLITADSDECNSEVERESILICREKSATRKELQEQLNAEQSALELIIMLQLDDKVHVSAGATQRLEMSKSAHQRRANRLKLLLKKNFQANSQITSIDQPNKAKTEKKPCKQPRRKNLKWKYPIVEGETRQGIEDYAQQFTKVFRSAYDKLCCSAGCNRNQQITREDTSSRCTPPPVADDWEFPERPEDTPEPVCSNTTLDIMTPRNPSVDQQERKESPLSVLHCHLPSAALLQYDWHAQLVHGLARICCAVRDYNEQDEAIRLASQCLREEEQAMRCIPLGDWHTYRVTSRSAYQRSGEIFDARNKQTCVRRRLIEAMTDWNCNVIEFNLFLRMNADLDQSRYIPRARVQTVPSHHRVVTAVESSNDYLTVLVTFPECALVHPLDTDSSYRVRVLLALTSLERK